VVRDGVVVVAAPGGPAAAGVAAAGAADLDQVPQRRRGLVAGGLVAVLPGSDPNAKAILLLAHIDVVLYGPSIFAQNIALENLTPGGYLVQDDALEPTCPGATLAVEEMIRRRGLSMEQVWPQIVFRAYKQATRTHAVAGD